MSKPADTFRDGTFQDDSAACIGSTSVEMSLTDLDEDHDDDDWDWTDDRPTLTRHHAPPPSPLTCEGEAVGPPFQRAMDHGASVCKGRV
ncbi:MAG TPA: hypothetical protein VFB62_02765 [Polyangiaceae bacterium]|jgi:hypothetical protein|nr:hypothetical protein [Polyangiaceae bacterium]